MYSKEEAHPAHQLQIIENETINRNIDEYEVKISKEMDITPQLRGIQQGYQKKVRDPALFAFNWPFETDIQIVNYLNNYQDSNYMHFFLGV